MRSTYAKLIATVFFWGSNFEIGKIAVQGFPPMVVAFIRFFFGAAFLTVIYYKNFGMTFPKYTIKNWLLILASAFFGVFCYNYFFFGGVGHISTARGSLLITSSNVFIVLLGAVLFKEKMNSTKWLGVVLAMCGVILVILRGDINKIGAEAWGHGETFIFLSGLCWTAYTIIGKYAMKEINTMQLSTFSAILGMLMLGLSISSSITLGTLWAASIKSWLAAAYIGITATGLGYIWYYDAVKKLGAAKASTVGTLTPVFAMLIAVVLGEKINLITCIGGLIVIIGIWLTNKK